MLYKSGKSIVNVNHPATEFLDLVYNNQKQGMKVAEVGVAEGCTTIHVVGIIKKNNGHLYAIDWFMGNTEVPDREHPHGYNSDESIVDYKFNFFYNRLRSLFSSEEEMDKYVTIIKGDSSKMSENLEDDSLDICYIDAGHSYEFVKKDIQSYYPKVKSGGILGGHDYGHGHPEVVRAVNEAFGEKVYALNNPKRQHGHDYGSWFIVK